MHGFILLLHIVLLYLILTFCKWCFTLCILLQLAFVSSTFYIWDFPMSIHIVLFYQFKLLYALILCEYTIVSLSILLMGIWVSNFSNYEQIMHISSSTYASFSRL